MVGVAAMNGFATQAVALETNFDMALSVLAYNLTRVMNIVGTRALLAAIRA